jgi:Tfp pilus assembly protein PilX
VKKEQEKKRSKTPLVVLLIILILIFLGVGATVGGKYLARRAENSLNSVIAEVPAVFQQAMEATVAEANKQIQNGNVLPPPPPGPGMTQVVPSEEGEGTTDLTTQVAATTEAKPTAPRSWPHLQLVGVVGKGKNGAAMISGSVVAAGDEINGVTVLEVRSNGALLEFNGEQRFLKTGGHIE